VGNLLLCEFLKVVTLNCSKRPLYKTDKHLVFDESHFELDVISISYFRGA
jgi:hypothetical protein